MELDDSYRRVTYTPSFGNLANRRDRSKDLTDVTLSTLPCYHAFNINPTVIQFCNGVPGIAISARLDQNVIFAHHPHCYHDALYLAKQFRVHLLIKEGEEKIFKIVKLYEKDSVPFLTYSPHSD